MIVLRQNFPNSASSAKGADTDRPSTPRHHAITRSYQMPSTIEPHRTSDKEKGEASWGGPSSKYL